MSAPSREPRGLLVGRFQPFHRGHLEVVRALRAAHPSEELILAIGSSQLSYTYDNPFTASERFEMIRRALSEAHLEGTFAIPLPDIGRHALWVAHAEETLPGFHRVHTNNPLTRLLFERAGYAVQSPTLVDREHLEGQKIRDLLAAAGRWSERVPPAVAAYLMGIGAPERVRLLRGAGAVPQASVA
jgi:nicotinamide-nucleotide adenylyltransferase